MPYTRIYAGQLSGHAWAGGGIELPEEHLRSLLWRAVVRERDGQGAGKQGRGLPPEELERDRVEAGVVDGGESVCVCVLDCCGEPFLERLVRRLGADHEVLRVVEEDAWRRSVSCCSGEGTADVPVGRPAKSRTITPPSTASGMGSIACRTACETQSAWPSLLWRTTGRPARTGSASIAFCGSPGGQRSVGATGRRDARTYVGHSSSSHLV